MVACRLGSNSVRGSLGSVSAVVVLWVVMVPGRGADGVVRVCVAGARVLVACAICDSCWCRSLWWCKIVTAAGAGHLCHKKWILLWQCDQRGVLNLPKNEKFGAVRTANLL
jgi:hypothetical protein